MSVTEQRVLQLAVDFEGTATNGAVELSIGKGLRTLFAHRNLDLKGGSAKTRRNEVIHDVSIRNMRVSTAKDPGSSSSSTICKSFTVTIPAITMPAHLVGLGDSSPGVVCHDNIPTSLELPFNVDDHTLKRVAESQGWTSANLKSSYVQTAKGIYVIKVQDRSEEAISPVLRAYLGSNGLKYASVADLTESGIAGVVQDDLDNYVAMAKKWMDEIPTNSLSLRDLKLVVQSTDKNAESERIKVSGVVVISYSTLENSKVEKTVKSTRKASKSKSLSHRHGHHHDSEESHSSSSSSSRSSSSSGGHSESDDEEDLGRPLKSSVLKKKGDRTSKPRAARSAHVKK